jgi:hypothetical protein
MVDKAIHMFADLRQWEEAKVNFSLKLQLQLHALEHMCAIINFVVAELACMVLHAANWHYIAFDVAVVDY